MDGLLGIGSAGGNVKNKNEGQLLAARLDSMRQERDMRSKQKKAEKAVPPTMPVAVPEKEVVPAGYDDSGVVELTGAATNNRGNPRKSKKKKKKHNKK